MRIGHLLIVALLAWVCGPAVAEAVPAREQITSGFTAGGTSVAVVFTTKPTTTGNAIIVIYANFFSATGPASVVDDSGSTYTQDTCYWNQGTVCVHSAPNITGKTNHTVTVSRAASFWMVVAIEVSGLDTSSIGDQTGANGGSSYTSGNTASATTVNDEYLVGAHHTDNTNADAAAPSAGWGKAFFMTDGAFQRMLITEQIVSTTGTYASDGTSDFHSDNVIMTYKGATGGGGGPAPATTLTSLGVGK